MAVGGGGTVLTSLDGGATWTSRVSGTSYDFSGVACPSAALCVAVGGTEGDVGAPLATSTDGGVDWTMSWDSQIQLYMGVACPSADLCLAVGEDQTIVRSTNPGGAGAAAAKPPAAGTVEAQCAGPHDLRVHDSFRVVHGDLNVRDVCVTGGGVLVLDGPLTLHADQVLIAADSEVSADAPRHVEGGDGCEQVGDPAYPLTIEARSLVLEGTISAVGGDGLAFGCDSGYGDNVNGGAGGKVTLLAQTLRMTGSIMADGGNAGGQMGGTGGAGGILLVAAGNIPAGLPAEISVRGGKGDPVGKGRAGADGKVTVQPISAAQKQLLPPAPAPDLQVLGTPPARQLPAPSFSSGMACGAHDLDVGPGKQVILEGTQVYGHVCVHGGGILRAGPQLTLIAQTIQVDAASWIDADGVITSTTKVSTTGPALAGGAQTWPRSALPAGRPGAQGAANGSQSDIDDGDAFAGLPGGAGGGSLTLIAGRLDMAGTISAAGAAGGYGGLGTITGVHSGNDVGTGNAGGGSGGGILLVARSLQLTGTVSVLGGDAGHFVFTARYAGAQSQPGGAPGRVTVLADVIAGPMGDLHICRTCRAWAHTTGRSGGAGQRALLRRQQTHSLRSIPGLVDCPGRRVRARPAAHRALRRRRCNRAVLRAGRVAEYARQGAARRPRPLAHSEP